MRFGVLGKSQNIGSFHFALLEFSPGGKDITKRNNLSKQTMNSNAPFARERESTFTDPILFHKIERLYLIAHQRVLRFPKVSRHSLGIRIENIVLEIIEFAHIAITKQYNSRLLILNKIDVLLKVLQVNLRIANKTKCLTDNGFAELSAQTVEIGRIIGGWIVKTKTAKE